MRDGRNWRDDYAGMFSRFFKEARLSSTYKPVLAAALVDISDGVGREGQLARREWIRLEEGSIRVDLNLVAALLARFYWEMAAGMGLRHTPLRMADPDNPDNDVVILRLIRDELEKRKRRDAYRDMADADDDLAGEAKEPRDHGRFSFVDDKPPTIEELASEEMAEFRKKVIDYAIKPEALKHLLTDMEGVYAIFRGEDAIMLDVEAAAHMRRNAATIRAALAHMIARHLEAINPSARHLATMADLNAEYDARIGRVRKQEASAASQQEQQQQQQQDDIGSLYTISLDLATGLARLAKSKEQERQ